MLGDLKFCSMFVPLCSSVCFCNVGCWHVPVLGPLHYRRAQKKEEKIVFRRIKWKKIEHLKIFLWNLNLGNVGDLTRT